MAVIAGEIVWNYLQLGQTLHKADLIMVCGSNDIRVAERAVEVFQAGLAPRILFSGGRGNFTETWDQPEAVTFSLRAAELGVPSEAMLLETTSSNTGQNVRNSHRLLEEQNFQPSSVILVQKPFMERRTYATFMKQWPGREVETMVTSPRISFEQYPNENLSQEEILHTMVGDLQRIIEYPKLGFQISQEVPQTVVDAMEKLIALGYTNHLISV